MADLRLLPPGIADERSRAFLGLLDRFDELDLSAVLVNHVDAAASAVLPALAWQLGLTGAGWALADTDASRRDLVRRAIELHRTRGTPWAVREALAAVGFPGARFEEGRPPVTYAADVQHDGSELHTGAGRWATFAVELEIDQARGLTAAERTAIERAIDEWKPARSHLVGLRFRLAAAERLTPEAGGRLRARVQTSEAVAWGRGVVLHDGRITHADSVLDLRHDGTLRFAGATTHRRTEARFAAMDRRRERNALSARTAGSTRVSATAPHRGLWLHDGGLRHGGNPCVIDGAETDGILATRFDATLQSTGSQPGAPTYGGGRRHDGGSRHFPRLTHDGRRLVPTS